MSGVAAGPAAPGVPGLVPASGITDAMVAAGAAIAESKLALQATTTLGAATPAAGVASAAVGGVLGTIITGSVNVLSTVGLAETVNFQVETGIGTGAYTTVQDFFEPVGANGDHKTFWLWVPTGRRWRWTSATGTSSIDQAETVAL